VSPIDASAFGFARVGEGTQIFELTRITSPERISLGSQVVVDDFVFLQGGAGLDIGSYVHIASFASITGGGEGVIGACAGISAGARVFTGTDRVDGSGLIGPRIPPELRSVERLRTEVGPHALIGANAVVLPGVVVGAGAVIGAGAVVTSDVEPWTVNVGAPARAVKRRPSETILAYARLLGIGED